MQEALQNYFIYLAYKWVKQSFTSTVVTKKILYKTEVLKYGTLCSQEQSEVDVKIQKTIFQLAERQSRLK